MRVFVTNSLDARFRLASFAPDETASFSFNPGTHETRGRPVWRQVFCRLTGRINGLSRARRAVLAAPDKTARAHDRILRCRINAAFRNQVERRIWAAERGARRNLSCAQLLERANFKLIIDGRRLCCGQTKSQQLRMNVFDTANTLAVTTLHGV
jgi:hypothetical protein